MMTKSILKLTDVSGCSVAYSAALYNCLPDWAKRSKDILLLDNGLGEYVVHALASLGTLPIEIITPDILRLKDSSRQTVLFALVSGRHLSPEILLLPLTEDTRVFEYLRSKQFRKQAQSKEDIVYVEEQLAMLEALIQKKAVSELLVQMQNHDCKGIER